jgi:hypothetical protein
VGSSGGRSSKTSTVIRTANTPSENALSRSGVALGSTVISFPVALRQVGHRHKICQNDGSSARCEKSGISGTVVKTQAASAM